MPAKNISCDSHAPDPPHSPASRLPQNTGTPKIPEVVENDCAHAAGLRYCRDLPVGAGLLANPFKRSILASLTHRIREQAGSHSSDVWRMKDRRHSMHQRLLCHLAYCGNTMTPRITKS